MKLSLAVFILATCVCVSIGHAQQINYDILPVTDPIGLRHGDAILGDFDLDGDQDLVTVGYAEEDPTPIIGREAGPFSEYYRNDGISQIEIRNPQGEIEFTDGAVFTQLSDGPNLVGLWQSAVAAHDYDHDGRLDLGMLGLDESGNARLYIYQSNQFTVFELAYSLDGLYSGDLDWGDLDNDGDVDLIACGRNERGNPQVIQYENTGLVVNRFIITSSTFVNLAECDLDLGDYDSDGDLDLAIAGQTDKNGSMMFVYENNGDGRFSQTSHSFKSRGWPSVSWSDFDSDGDLDLAHMGSKITPSSLEGELTIYRYESGAFVEKEDVLTPGRYHGSIHWGDQNYSGYPDFVITGFESPLSSISSRVYLNDRGTQFYKCISGSGRTLPPNHPCVLDPVDGGAGGIATWFDHDSDQRLDILLFGEAPRQEILSVRVLRNQISILPSEPSAPTNLNADVRSGSVVLSWDSGADLNTPETGLSYNLRIGTSPGAIDVVSPLTYPSSGRRLVSRRGNVDHNRSWKLNDLESGRYYWSVQTLNQAFSSSSFSEEQVFEITEN